MSSNRVRRIAKEIDDVRSDTESNISLNTSDDGHDLTHLEGRLEGPPDTPYEGGTYYIDIRIPDEYPFRPPAMKFKTKIWHPNVSSQTGAICLDTLSTAWSPVFTIKATLLSIQSMLESPEPKDPQDAEVAGMLLKDPEEFARVAREWAVKHAGALYRNTPGDNGKASLTQRVHIDAEQARLQQFRGYNEALVKRFTAMGFDTPNVVAAFEDVNVETRGGAYYELREDQIAAITDWLFGE